MCSGSGHGWAGAQQVLWNCTAQEIILHDPPAATTNWAIGCTASFTANGDFDNTVEPLGFIESENNPIAAIPSLYEAQLAERYPATVGIDDLSEADLMTKLIAYPNPTADKLLIKNLVNGADLRIYNITGQLMMTEYYSDYLNVSLLDPGLYLVQIDSSEGRHFIRMVKE